MAAALTLMRCDRARLDRDAAHELRHLLPPPPNPRFIVRGRDVGAARRPLEAPDTLGVVSHVRPARECWPVGFRVADVVEVDAIHVVPLDDVEVDRHERILGLRVAGIEEVADGERLPAVASAGQPAVLAGGSWPVKVEYMVHVLRWRLVAPYRHGIDPRVYLQPGRMRLLHDVREGVE